MHPLPAGEPVTLLEDDAAEPGGECLRRAQLPQIEIGLNERLLGGVFRQVEVSQDGIGVSDRHVLEMPNDRGKCRRVALLRSRHALLPARHVGSPFRRVLHLGCPTSQPRGSRVSGMFWYRIRTSMPLPAGSSVAHCGADRVPAGVRRGRLGSAPTMGRTE